MATTDPPEPGSTERAEYPGTADIHLSVDDSQAASPTFSWQPLDGASYVLAVDTDQGEPVWAWSGSEATVALGNVPASSTEALRLSEPSKARLWAVDAAGDVVAVSNWVPLSGGG